MSLTESVCNAYDCADSVRNKAGEAIDVTTLRDMGSVTRAGRVGLSGRSGDENDLICHWGSTNSIISR